MRCSSRESSKPAVFGERLDPWRAAPSDEQRQSPSTGAALLLFAHCQSALAHCRGSSEAGTLRSPGWPLATSLLWLWA
jgi:hypothetical protein